MKTTTRTEITETRTTVMVEKQLIVERKASNKQGRSTTGSTAASSSLLTDTNKEDDEEDNNPNNAAVVVLLLQVEDEATPTRLGEVKANRIPPPPPPPQPAHVVIQPEVLGVTTSTVTTNSRNHHCTHQNHRPSSPRSKAWFGKRLWRRHKKSLSRAPTTPCWVALLIPLLSLATHYIFYYGQTRDMWHLHLSQQVDLWANASNIESRRTFDILGLPHENYIGSHKEKQVRTFSYWYAIKELWKAAHMPGKVLPRLAAVLLVVFSGIWPHVKLLLLNFTWLFSVHQRRRTRMLMWLSTLGKWSLADVLVVCVMVGVLHLDWTVDPQAIRAGLIENLPFCLRVLKSLYSASDICSLLFKHLDCHVHHESWKKWSECKACVALVKTALNNPNKARDTFQGVLDGIEMSGGGQVTLRVQGLKGIYAFCGAVIFSILISLLVDILDVRAHRAHHARSIADAGGEEDNAFLLPQSNDSSSTRQDDHSNSNEGDSYDMEEPLLLREDIRRRDGGDNMMEEGQAYQEFLRSTSAPVVSLLSIVGHIGLLILSLSTGAAVFTGIFANTIQRRVYGAIPDVLRDVLGVVWDRYYSLWTLVQTTGAKGGWDYMLMGTFGLFIVAGPALRATLCLVAWFVPSDGKHRGTLLALIELVGAFCAWEVFAIAVGMVDMLMPAITSTVVLNPQCANVSADGTCLTVNFDLQRSFFIWVVMGGGLLLVLSNLFFSGSRRPPALSR